MQRNKQLVDKNFAPQPGLVRGDTINNHVLAANTELVIAIPAGATAVYMGGDCNYWVSVDDAATCAGDVTDGTGSVMNPVLVDVSGGTELRVISTLGGRIFADWRA
jgi:hypothetical protein